MAPHEAVVEVGQFRLPVDLLSDVVLGVDFGVGGPAHVVVQGQLQAI